MPLLFHLPTRFLDMGDFWQGHVPYPEGNGIIYLFLNSSQVEYLCQKYEALQKQLASVERNCAEQVQRQELLQRELRSLRDAQPQVT